MKWTIKLIREIIGMGFMFMAGAYQTHSELAAGHLTVENMAIASVIIVTGRIIFG